MVQNPKGGGLSSSFGGGAQQMGGVQKTTDFLDKSTWILGAALLILILLSNLALERDNSNTNESKLLNSENTNEYIPEESIPEPLIPEVKD
tara:strand:+ start:107 stop:379 length:273 start_codon:yes stop_codon:yes gene_type:complete